MLFERVTVHSYLSTSLEIHKLMPCKINPHRNNTLYA